MIFSYIYFYIRYFTINFNLKWKNFSHDQEAGNHLDNLINETHFICELTELN